MKRWGQMVLLVAVAMGRGLLCALRGENRKRAWAFVVLLGALYGFVLWVSPSHAAMPTAVSAQEDPAKALENVQSAIDTGDNALLERHVDVDGLIRAGVDYFLAEAKNDTSKNPLPPVLGMILSTVGQSETGKMSFRSLVGGEARNFVVYGVQSGSFAGTKRDNAPPPEGLLAPLFAEASLGRKEIRQARRPQMQGNDCLISFVVYDYGNGQSYPVQGLWQVVDGHWRLVKVENLSALLGQIRREAEE